MKFVKNLQSIVPWVLVLLFGNTFSVEEKCEGCNNSFYIGSGEGEIPMDYEIPSKFQSWYDMRQQDVHLQQILSNIQKRLENLEKRVVEIGSQLENETKPTSISVSNNICGEVLTSQRGFIKFQFEQMSNTTLDTSTSPVSCMWTIHGNHEHIKITTNTAMQQIIDGSNFAYVLEPGQTHLEMKSTNLIARDSQLFKGPVVFVGLAINTAENTNFSFQLEYEAVGEPVTDTCFTHQLLEYTPEYHFNSENSPVDKHPCAQEVITLNSKFHRKTSMQMRTTPEQCNSTQLIVFSKKLTISAPGTENGIDCCKTECNAISASRYNQLLIVIRKQAEVPFEFNTTMIQEQVQSSSYVNDGNMTSSCGGLVTGMEGAINYKSSIQYSNNERCIWAIVPGPYQAQSIAIKLNKYGLEANQHDKLYIMEITANNGSMLNKPKITNIVGENAAYTAYGSHVYIIFYSDISIQGKGFQLTYSANKDNDPPSIHLLNQFNFLHQQTGSLIGHSIQPPVFQVVAITPSISESQTVSVLNLDFPNESICLLSNSIYIYTTMDGVFKADETLCNNRSKSTPSLSIKERMVLIVVPNAAEKEFGELLKIDWETKSVGNHSFVKTDGKQCGGVVEAESGVIQYTPNGYNNNTQCSWTIISKGGLKFKLSEAGFASRGTVTLLKADYDTGLLTPLGNLSRSNQTLEVNSSAAILIFTPNQNQTGVGFVVKFETVLDNMQTDLVQYIATHTSTKSGQFTSTVIPYREGELFQTMHIFTYQANSSDSTQATFDLQYGMFRKGANHSCQYEVITVYEFGITNTLNQLTQLPSSRDNQVCQDIVPVSKLDPWFDVKSQIVFILYKIFYRNPLASFSWKEKVAPKIFEPKWVYPYEISRNDLEPAGKEGSSELYIARGLHGNDWIPGKMFGRHGNQVWFGYYGEKSTSNIQVLYIPAGTTKWVNPNTDGTSAAIYGGAEPAFSLYICRVWVQGNLITGKYSKSTSKCYVSYSGKEHQTTTGIELLVRAN